MKASVLDNLKLVWRVINLALPMVWLVTMAVWGLVAGAL